MADNNENDALADFWGEEFRERLDRKFIAAMQTAREASGDYSPDFMELSRNFLSAIGKDACQQLMHRLKGDNPYATEEELFRFVLQVSPTYQATLKLKERLRVAKRRTYQLETGIERLLCSAASKNEILRHLEKLLEEDPDGQETAKADR